MSCGHKSRNGAKIVLYDNQFEVETGFNIGNDDTHLLC